VISARLDGANLVLAFDEEAERLLESARNQFEPVAEEADNGPVFKRHRALSVWGALAVLATGWILAGVALIAQRQVRLGPAELVTAGDELGPTIAHQRRLRVRG
jgi:hypothetical protein